LTGGYVLLAVLIAPFLRNLDVQTVPGFMAARYGGCARLVGLIALVVCSTTFLVAVLHAAMPIAARVLGANEDTALAFVLAVTLLCAFPGGLHAATATQVGQYVALIVGGVTLFLIIEAQRFDAPSGPGYDPVIEALEAIVHGLGLAPAHSPRSIPFRWSDVVGNLEFVVCLMAGTASLPHILARPLATLDTGHARKSPAWSLLFIAILVFVLPTYVTLLSDDASREQSGLVAGLVAVIGLTAMLAAASGLLVVIANSLELDALERLFAREHPIRGQLIIARVLLVAVAASAAYLVKTMPAEPLSWMAWSFSLAAAGFFPALVMGIWWPRTTAAGAICGSAAGFGLCAF
jgi:cation/acetate symporter